MLLSVCLFSQGPPGPCGSLLCQDFLAEILICLPSRWSQSSLLFGLHRVGAGEKLPGYYLYSRIFSSLPCDTVSKQHIIQLGPHVNSADATTSTPLWSQFSLPDSTLSPAHFLSTFSNLTSVSYGGREDAGCAHSNDSVANMLMKWHCGWNINLLGDRVVLPLPRQLPFGSWWPLFTSVPRHWHLATKAKEESEPASMAWLQYTQTSNSICRHERDKQTWGRTELRHRVNWNEQTHRHMCGNNKHTHRNERIDQKSTTTQINTLTDDYTHAGMGGKRYSAHSTHSTHTHAHPEWCKTES